MVGGQTHSDLSWSSSERKGGSSPPKSEPFWESALGQRGGGAGHAERSVQAGGQSVMAAEGMARLPTSHECGNIASCRGIAMEPLSPNPSHPPSNSQPCHAQPAAQHLAAHALPVAVGVRVAPVLAGSGGIGPRLAGPLRQPLGAPDGAQEAQEDGPCRQPEEDGGATGLEPCR